MTLKLDSLQHRGQIDWVADTGFTFAEQASVGLPNFNRSCNRVDWDFDKVQSKPWQKYISQPNHFGQTLVSYFKRVNFSTDSIVRGSLWYGDTPVTVWEQTYRNAPYHLHFDTEQGNQVVLMARNHTRWVQNQYWEQLMPKEFADTRFLVPVLEQYDSIMVAVLFWEDNTELFLDDRSLGFFNHDTIARLHLHQATELRATKPIQIQASTFSDTNRLEENEFGNTIDYSFHGNWASSGFRPDAPKDYITHAIFKPFPSVDTAQAPFVNLTCPSQAIRSMRVNGKPLNPGLFTPYAAAPDFSYLELPLSFDTNYVVENPQGFLGIQYTKPTVSGAFVPTYALTLSETPFVEDSVFGRFSFKRPVDSNWLTQDTLVVCPQTPMQLRLPQYRFTQWRVFNSLLNTDTLILVGENESAPLSLSGLPEGSSFYITATDVKGCVPNDTLWVEVKPLPPLQTQADLEPSCQGFLLRLKASPHLIGAQYTWRVKGTTLDASTPQVTVPLDYLDIKNFRVDYSVTRNTPTCTDSLNTEIALPNPFDKPFPNVFSPNGDGRNDCLHPPDLLGLDCANFSVYNRYGQKLWDKSQSPCWDGTLNGNPVAEGVYYYLFSLGAYQFKGFVHLVR